MSEIRHRHRILEAIDQLRRRKARPDVNRICSFMFRRFSVSCGETKADLQKLIDAEIVIKVDYKGNTSYRNAAKWAMLPNYKNKQELDSSNTSSILSSAVAELIVLEPDYLDIGVPALELEKHLLKKDTKRFTKKNLENVLKREIENGTLVKLENGNYFLGEHSNASKQNASHSNANSTPKSVNKTPLSAKPKTKKLKPIKPADAPPTFDTVQTENNCSNLEYKEEQKDKMDENVSCANSNSSTTNTPVTTTTSAATNSNNCENVAFRVGGRQKRAKVMFDPSDNNLPKISRKRPPGRPPISVGKSISSVNRVSTNSTIRSSSITNSTSSLLIGGSCVTVGPSKSAAPYQGVNTAPATNVPLNNPSICCLCHSYGVRIKGVPERLITCADCSCSKAHPSCIETKREGSCRNRNGLWQCIQCKHCTICDETGKAGKIAFCTTCSEAYHYICHNPHVPLTTVDMEKWECSKCTSISKIKSTSMNNVNNNNEECKDNEDVKDILPVKVEAPTSSISPSGIKNSSKIVNNCNSDNKNSCLVVSSTAGSALVNDVSSRTSTGAQSSSSCSSVSCCVVSTTSTETAPKTICSPSNQSCTATTTAASKIDVTEGVKEEKEGVKVIAKPVTTSNDVNEMNNVQTKKEFIVPVLNDDSPLAREPKSQYLLPPACLQDPYDGYPVDETIPDASHWSPQEVFQYFVKHFDTSTAKIFKDQEIDGQSLLLMKRADVLTGLCLKLGPALKVYSHVKKLQIRRSHPKLLWS